MKLFQWLGLDKIQPRPEPPKPQPTAPVYATAAQARESAASNKAKLDEHEAATIRASKQKAIDHWEKYFNDCIQNGVANGKIGGIIDRHGQPQLHQELIDKLESHGFHICVDNTEYGYTDIVIINWELKKPNFYDQNWDNYWQPVGTKVPPNSSF